MSRTFSALVGSLTSEPFLLNHKWGYQQAEKLRQNLDLLAYVGGILDLGGSDDLGQLTASYLPVRGYRDYSLDNNNLGGFTKQVVIYSRTAAVGTSVTVRLRNTTAGSDAAVSTTITSTTTVKEVVTITLASGANDYRLEVVGGNATAAVYAWGYIRLRHVPT